MVNHLANLIIAKPVASSHLGYELPRANPSTLPRQMAYNLGYNRGTSSGAEPFSGPTCANLN